MLNKSDKFIWNIPRDLPANWQLIESSRYCGYYRSRTGLSVIISASIEQDNKVWIHLSVAHKKYLPTWEELRQVKELFLGKESLALQVIPPQSEYVNLHKNCLHLYQCLEERPVPDFRYFGTI